MQIRGAVRSPSPAPARPGCASHAPAPPRSPAGRRHAGREACPSAPWQPSARPTACSPSQPSWWSVGRERPCRRPSHADRVLGRRGSDPPSVSDSAAASSCPCSSTWGRSSAIRSSISPANPVQQLGGPAFCSHRGYLRAAPCRPLVGRSRAPHHSLTTSIAPPMMPSRKELVSFSRGSGSAGSGISRNSHSGSHPFGGFPDQQPVGGNVALDALVPALHHGDQALFGGGVTGQRAGPLVPVHVTSSARCSAPTGGRSPPASREVVQRRLAVEHAPHGLAMLRAHSSPPRTLSSTLASG